MLRKGIREDCPEVRREDAQHDYRQPKGEYHVRRIDGLSCFHDSRLSQLPNLKLIGSHDDGSNECNEPNAKELRELGHCGLLADRNMCRLYGKLT